VKFIKLRYVLRNYTMALMEDVAATGTPVNRPLSFEYPADAKAWKVTDQYMFGPTYMTAPVYHAGARNRSVYFPAAPNCGAWKRWAPAAGNSSDSDKSFSPGSSVNIPVPLDELAMFECVPHSLV
jgi:alpha-D-xyloside xylohydrolase